MVQFNPRGNIPIIRDTPFGPVVSTPKIEKAFKKNPNPSRPVGDAEFAHIADDKSRLFIVTMMTRPGAGVFLVDLEYHHYPPGSPKNHDFQMIVSVWSDMEWATIHVPIEHKELVEEVAKRNGMRLADGVPTLLGNGAPEVFPVNGDNVFTLENVADSPVYKGGGDKVMREQQRRIEEIIKEFERTNVDPIEGSGGMSE